MPLDAAFVGVSSALSAGLPRRFVMWFGFPLSAKSSFLGRGFLSEGICECAACLDAVDGLAETPG